MFIMMDDCERTAENQTTLEIERCLKRYSIPYKRGRYVGQKEFVLILSKNLGVYNLYVNPYRNVIYIIMNVQGEQR